MPAPLQDIREEATELVERAEGEGTLLRLLGGLAVALHCRSAERPALKREYGDIDVAALSRQSRGVKGLLEGRGYVPNEMFNAIRGGSRLMYFDLANRRRLDVFLDRFSMCHTIDLRPRLPLARPTLPLADLLLTKLQVYQITQKDLIDITALVLDHEVAQEEGQEVINGCYVAALCSRDWGLYRTSTRTLEACLALLPKLPLEEGERSVVADRLGRLRAMIEEVPKSLRWRLRARLGERVRWYKLPEEPE